MLKHTSGTVYKRGLQFLRKIAPTIYLGPIVKCTSDQARVPSLNYHEDCGRQPVLKVVGVIVCHYDFLWVRQV